MLRKIAEAQYSRSRDIILHILDEDIPVSPKVLKFLEKPKKQYYFHVTNVSKIESLIRRQKSNKQISVFDSWSGQDIFSGPVDLPSNDPVVVVLKGSYSFKFPGDAWTNYDKEGNRWIEGRDGFSKDLREVLINISEYALKKMGKEFLEKLEMYKDDKFGYMIYPKKFTKLIPRGTRSKLIKDYFDNMYLAFKKYEKDLQKAFKLHDKMTYNELIAYDYEVVEFLVPEQTSKNRSINTQGYKTTLTNSTENIEKILKTYLIKNK